MDGRLLPCGERAVLVEVAGLDEVGALRSAVRSKLGDGAFAPVVDVIPAVTTVLLTVDDPAALDPLRAALRRLLPGLDAASRPEAEGAPIEIGVVYDGADLDEVGGLTGLGADGVVAAHTASDWRVAFGGFAPGFGYLTGGDPRLTVPRRSEPRTSVPAGSVGLAGSFSGIYPRASPGGWQLIGRTDAVLWDAERDPPALLQPGRRVRFLALDGEPAAPLDTRPAVSTGSTGEDATFVGDGPEPGLEVIATGPLTLFVDEGRPGYAAIGVGRSGAADRSAYRLGGRLVGNPPGLAALEVTFGGLVLHAAQTCLIALTGADCRPRVDQRPAVHAGPLYLRAGQTLTLGAPRHGLRTYLSVAGGFAVPPVLGSASTDTLSEIGPAGPRPGDRLRPNRSGPPPLTGVEHAPEPLSAGTLVLDVLPGPRADWLAERDGLTRREWLVSGRSDRVGIRLEGDPLARHPDRRGDELPSEPMVRGAIQVPADGRPVIFGTDHPVTGGYPVVGVLTERSNDLVAQARPGQALRLRPAPVRAGRPAPWQ